MTVSAKPHSDKQLIKTCSIWRALEVVGDKPVLVILEAIWMGARRFGDLEKSTGLLKALLSNRLGRLIDFDLITKRPLSEGKRRHEYRLTSKGVDLFGTVMALYKWEQDWNKDRYKVQLFHHNCQSPFLPEFKCRSCGDAFELTEVDWAEGPGVGWTDNQYLRRRTPGRIATKRPSLLKGSVEILGDRWSALIMRSVFTGHRKFDDIQSELAIGTGVLADRLKRLQGAEILKSAPYQERPVRHAYTLTRKGLEYYQVIMMLMFWGDKHYADENGPPLILTHKKCGRLLNPQPACGQCGETLSPVDVIITSLQ